MRVYHCLVSQNNSKDEMDVIYKGILEVNMVMLAVLIYWEVMPINAAITERSNTIENRNFFRKTMLKNKVCGLMVRGTKLSIGMRRGV